MTDAWKASVEDWLAANGKDRSWLAKEIGVAPSTIMRVLEEQRSSEFVEAICKVTGLGMPVLELQNDWEQDVVGELRKLDDEARGVVMSYIKLLSGRSRKG